MKTLVSMLIGVIIGYPTGLGIALYMITNNLKPFDGSLFEHRSWTWKDRGIVSGLAMISLVGAPALAVLVTSGM